MDAQKDASGEGCLPSRAPGPRRPARTMLAEPRAADRCVTQEPLPSGGGPLDAPRASFGC